MYGGTRMCFLRANTGSFVAQNLMPLIPRLASREDVVLLNFGLHSNDNGTLWGYIQVNNTWSLIVLFLTSADKNTWESMLV